MAYYCLHALVTGRVQGVWFRDSARKQAQQLGITGWVRNCRDGRVEVMACGEQTILKQFEQWLWQGSPLAKVQNVDVEYQAWQQFDDFEIR